MTCFRLVLVAALWMNVSFLSGCGSAVFAPTPWPESPAERDRPLVQLGRDVFHAVQHQQPGLLLVSDDKLKTLLREESAHALGPARNAVFDAPAQAMAGRAPASPQALFAGACFQHSRVEEPTGPLGLLSQGWVVDRVLVEGRRPDGAPVGAWVEGSFLYTGERFVGLVVSRIEALRWQHADLALATCDQRVRVEPASSGDPEESGH